MADRAGGAEGPAPQGLGLIHLDALLVAVALAAEHEGSRVDARRLLEASWLIYRRISREATVVSRIVATGIMKFQVGALRKLQEPPVEWLNRLENEDAWRATLDAYESDLSSSASRGEPAGSDALPGSFSPAYAGAVRVWMEALRRAQPCQIGRMTAEEIGRPMREELQKRKVPGEDSAQLADVFTDIEILELIGGLKRAGRLAVDSELTAKILELRFDRAASRTNQWPRKLAVTQSRACPDAMYVYRRQGEGISLSFEGTAPALPAGLSLPLGFSSGSAPAAPTPSPAPAAKPKTTPVPAD